MVENREVVSCAPTGTPSSYPLPVAYHLPHAGEQEGPLLRTNRYTLLLPPSSCISSLMLVLSCAPTGTSTSSRCRPSPSCRRTRRSFSVHLKVHPPSTPVQLQTISIMLENRDVLSCAPKGTTTPSHPSRYRQFTYLTPLLMIPPNHRPDPNIPHEPLLMQPLVPLLMQPPVTLLVLLPQPLLLPPTDPLVFSPNPGPWFGSFISYGYLKKVFKLRTEAYTSTLGLLTDWLA